VEERSQTPTSQIETFLETPGDPDKADDHQGDRRKIRFSQIRFAQEDDAQEDLYKGIEIRIMRHILADDIILGEYLTEPLEVQEFQRTKDDEYSTHDVCHELGLTERGPPIRQIAIVERIDHEK